MDTKYKKYIVSSLIGVALAASTIFLVNLFAPKTFGGASTLRNIFLSDQTSGDSVNVVQNTNTENYELLVNLQGHECPENSTTTQLLADGVFTGSGWQDTLDYGVLSINVASDVDSAVDGLDVQWSYNGVDVIDHDYFTIYAGYPKTFTFGPAERYYRIVYTNGSASTTTAFHLSSVLRKTYVKPSSHRINDAIVGEDDASLVKAVLTGLAPDGTFVNITATKKGSQAINLVDNYEFEAENTPMGELRTATPHSLVGSTFIGTTIDPNFFTPTTTLGGTITQTSGQVLLQTGTTANATTKLTSVARARYNGGTSMRYRAVVQLTDGETGTVNNVRRWGAYDDDNGAFYELSSTTFRTCTRKATVDTCVDSDSWNGESFTMDLNVHTYEIYWTNSSVWFAIGDEMVNKMSAPTSTWSETMNLKIQAENYNTNGLDSNIQLGMRVASIYALGEITSAPRGKYIGTNATQVLKYGSGVLHRVTVTDNNGTLLIYDGLSAAGTLLANLDASKTVGTMEFNFAFNTGLTVVSAGTPKMTITFE